MNRKRLLIIFFLIMFIPVCLYAAEVSRSITFVWNQEQSDLSSLHSWKLYWSSTSGGPYTPVLDTNGNPFEIIYDPNDTDGEYTASQIMTVTGDPGATVRKYFVMTAVSADDVETEYSNEAVNTATGNNYVEFRIPSEVGVPFQLRVTVEVGQ